MIAQGGIELAQVLVGLSVPAQLSHQNEHAHRFEVGVAVVPVYPLFALLHVRCGRFGELRPGQKVETRDNTLLSRMHEMDHACWHEQHVAAREGNSVAPAIKVGRAAEELLAKTRTNIITNFNDIHR